MYAIVTESPGRNSQLSVGRREKPEAGAGELLIRIHATAINRADLLQRRGLYAPPPGATDILGLEMSGVVEKVGDNVADIQPGSRVASILPGGGYAEYVTIPASLAIPVADNIDFYEAAAIPEAFLTSYQLLHDIAAIQKGESVLIHAGASGIGTAAIQLARMQNARIFCTAGSSEKLHICEKLGSEIAINYRKNPDFSRIVLAETNGLGVNVVLDCIGKGYLPLNLNSLSIDGRYVLYGLLGGMEESVNLGIILQKRVHLEGTTLRNRSIEKKAALTMGFIQEYLPFFQSGQLKPIIYTVLPISKVEQGHRLLLENRTIGKVILDTSPDSWQ